MKNREIVRIFTKKFFILLGCNYLGIIIDRIKNPGKTLQTRGFKTLGIRLEILGCFGYIGFLGFKKQKLSTKQGSNSSFFFFSDHCNILISQTFWNFTSKKIISLKRAFSNLFLKGGYATCSASRKNFYCADRGLHKIKVLASRNAIMAHL